MFSKAILLMNSKAATCEGAAAAVNLHRISKISKNPGKQLTKVNNNSTTTTTNNNNKVSHIHVLASMNQPCWSMNHHRHQTIWNRLLSATPETTQTTTALGDKKGKPEKREKKVVKEKDPNHPIFTVEYTCSPELKTVLGVPKTTRSEALKLIWGYIREKAKKDELKKPTPYMADEPLQKLGFKPLFGAKDVMGVLSKNMTKIETEADKQKASKAAKAPGKNA